MDNSTSKNKYNGDILFILTGYIIQKLLANEVFLHEFPKAVGI